MARRRDEIWHFLYAEDLLRYCAYFNGWRGHRVIGTFHQPVDLLHQNIQRTAYLSRLSGAVVLSRAQIPYFAQFLPRHSIFFVPHGVDTAYFRPGEVRTNSTQRECIFVGSYERDIDMLHQVIAAVQHDMPTLRFRVVTSPRAIARLTQLGGLPNTELLMRIPDGQLLTIYQQADLMVMPLLRCTANNAILESLACAVPVVATDIGGVPDYVDQTCGALARPGDLDDMVSHTLRLLRSTTQLLELRRGARERALEFDLPLVAQQLKAVYAAIAH